MARINIEDSLFRDQRFTDLCIRLGSRPLALGWLVEAWILAQEQVSIDNPSGLIPLEKWQSRRMNDALIDVGLATSADRHVSLAGAKESFKWLVQRQEAASKGGIARAEKKRVQAESDEFRVPTGSRPAADRDSGDSGSSPLTLSPPLTPKKEDLTLITKSVGEDAPQTNKKGKVTFEVLKELSHPATDAVLSTISTTTQKQWVRHFHDSKWVRDRIAEAISYYTARGDTMADGWGIPLHRALMRARAAQNRAKGGVTLTDPRSADLWADVFDDKEAAGAK